MTMKLVPPKPAMRPIIHLRRIIPVLVVALAAFPALAVVAPGTLSVERVSGEPNVYLVGQTKQGTTGNTRFRYYPDRHESSPSWDPYAKGSRFKMRDRDIGQVFTVPEDVTGPLTLTGITFRVGPTPEANEGGAGGAKVSIQFFKVSGTPVLNDSGTSGNDQARWDTFNPDIATTDDFFEGLDFETLVVASGGVLPHDIGTDQFMRWNLTGAGRIHLEPGQQYAFLVMFDEPATKRGLALANLNRAWNGDLGPDDGGFGIRRCGASSVFEDVFIFDLDDAEEVERARWSTMLPRDPAVRYAIQPGTRGMPDVDTYRDFRYYIHAETQAPPPPPPGGMSGVFRESGGRVVMEAENFTGSATNGDSVSWRKASGDAGFVGSGYVETPDMGTSRSDWPTSAALHYDLDIMTPGSYSIWARRSQSATSQNSAWVGVDGSQIGERFDNGNDLGWAWVRHATQVQLGSGSHRFELRRRESGYRVDRLVLTTDASYVPSGNGPDESPRGDAPLTTSIQINFQPADAASVAGWAVDAGDVFGARANGMSYGWSTRVDQTRDRNRDSNQLRDTLNHMQKSGQPTWEIAVPNGDYLVTVLCGDPSFTDQVNHLVVEGVAVRDPDDQDHFDRYDDIHVTVTDGRLSIGAAADGVNAKICWLRIDPVQRSDIAINFQPAGAATVSGWAIDAGEAFGPREGGLSYGWSTRVDQTRDRNRDPDQLRDTLNHMQKSGRPTWEIAVPNGDYLVTVLCGDPSHIDQVNHLVVEGVAVRDPDGQDHFDRYADIPVTVADGRLSIQAASDAVNAKICWVRIEAVPGASANARSESAEDQRLAASRRVGPRILLAQIYGP